MHTLAVYPTIALVEDHAEIADVVYDILEQAGYGVTWYARADHLLSRLPEHLPDIVLLDGANAAFYSGWDQAARLRDHGCQVIMFTAHHVAIQEVGRTARGRAFAAAIAKPFDIDTLLTTIERVWQRA